MIQVVLNIALNAIEAMPEGGTLGFATAGIESGGGKTIEIAIRDTGCGIGKDDLKNIFKPFFTTKKKGDRSRSLSLSENCKEPRWPYRRGINTQQRKRYFSYGSDLRI